MVLASSMVAGGARQHRSLPTGGGWLRCKTEQTEKCQGKTEKHKVQTPSFPWQGCRSRAGMGATPSDSLPQPPAPSATPQHRTAATGTFHCISINPAVPGLPPKLMQRPILKIKQNKRGRIKKKYIIKGKRGWSQFVILFPEHPRPQATFKLRRLQAVCSLPWLFSCLLGNFSLHPPSLT